jgi:hypothetical protein
MRFFVPRFIALLVVCVGVALTTAGCNPFLDYNYYSQGIGTNVYNSAIAAETEAQDVYLNALCEQAGLQSGIYVAGQYSCIPTVRPGDWSAIVQAGFNDIDQRCDGYLAWLDEQRRLKAPILNEINTIQVAAQNIMGLAAASVKSINIVGLAFGFASNTFTNIQSGLLLEIDKSTVETVVIQGQNNYRATLPGPIDNRATAIYVLRSYLRICTPYTIANQINTTVTLFHSNAGQGSPLIDSSVVRASITQNARTPLAPTPQVKVGMASAATSFERDLSLQDGRNLQQTLCASPTGDFGPPNLPVGQESATRQQLRQFNAAFRYGVPGPIDQLLNTTPDTISTFAQLLKLRQAQQAFPSCSAAGMMNGFEVGIFTRFTIPAIKLQISAALAKNNLSTPANFDAKKSIVDAPTRQAITSLRTVFDHGSPELDPKFYDWLLQASSRN